MSDEGTKQRSMGLVEATSVGVGAIVGGGILALAGVAFATTGPSAILAFALNGLLALLTACSFAELSGAFPQSGGTYTYAKKVLSVETAFAIGWVVWFASIAAGVLYSLGFGYFMAAAVAEGWGMLSGQSPAWLTARPAVVVLGVAATAFYAFRLTRKSGGAAHWENLGKLAVFAVLIAGGLYALAGRPLETVGAGLSPFFSGGALGLFQAMGFTFIALQGFDLIAAAGGEIRDPARTVPRAMFWSLGIALAVYLPLLFAIAAAGVEPGQSIAAASRENPEEIVAVAARRFLGAPGYWLVLVAATLSMLSALRANLFAASRIASAMARDRTMPYLLAKTDRVRDTPVAAVLATALIIAAVVVVLPDVAAAGAASSLIFLITFAAAHWIAILARRRRRVHSGAFQTPWFPLVPAAGIAACLALAAYQAATVPSAGLVAGVWLCMGGVLFLGLLARPARVVDASAEAQDPEISRLRGRTPLVLVPVANPTSAEALVAVANALTPPDVGRVLLLSVAVLPRDWKTGDNLPAVRHAEGVLGDTLIASSKAGLFPEALATVAVDPWQEIDRIAREHRCESLLLGLTSIEGDWNASPLNGVLSAAACEVLVLRAPPGWQLSSAREILVPLGGRGGHDRLRARLLGSLFRTGDRRVTFLRVVPETAPPPALDRARRELARIARDEAPGRCQAKIVAGTDVARVIVEHAAETDLVILGVERTRRHSSGFGQMTLRIARESASPILIISHRGR